MLETAHLDLRARRGPGAREMKPTRFATTRSRLPADDITGSGRRASPWLTIHVAARVTSGCCGGLMSIETAAGHALASCWAGPPGCSRGCSTR